jgi:hypothetical protein
MNPQFGSKHVEDIKKFKHEAFCCFMLYNYFTIHGAKN